MKRRMLDIAKVAQLSATMAAEDAARLEAPINDYQYAQFYGEA